ncbi:DUF7547 family protein [Halomarina rubra]|uniref:Uncharacterized protein n=1 Tax=Halomarina rubra TaxID=2071873 RepID=A0ABD6B1H2_9EURY|nr:hypothetical protein [Halomarina rubra]
MSRRSDDDLAALLDELSGTLDRLQTELDADRGRGRRPDRREDRTERSDERSAERPRDEGRRDAPRRRERTTPSLPRPGRFLQFTEEYTIPALIAFLEANIRALELLRGLLRLLNGGEVSERRVESVGRRTLGRVDDLLVDLQDAVEGTPSNPEARDLLDDARSLRADIDERIASGGYRDRVREDSELVPGDSGHDRRPDDRRGRDPPVTIDVTDGDDSPGERARRRGEDHPEGRARRDEVDVDSELDSLRKEVRGDEDGADDGVGTGADEDGDDEDDENGS